ncbi:uncharacterized protein BDR25DRAFT_378694 [Lindgomyces ingoldianus]|uniref:Uncharacterized protein n=1 Tax=Lindgomyces ingoldianus TaxID=673940 RepID=A0ACB6QHA9_9PLEO|nr:uncharacterized protein BDR25DRAFT_378694 [Lindgomyces ingoldianus]KAF2465531.1 hypothetical protein BDR25DRAFT_378694 [Lindgomyces ingoldianus]
MLWHFVDTISSKILYRTPRRRISIKYPTLQSIRDNLRNIYPDPYDIQKFHEQSMWLLSRICNLAFPMEIHGTKLSSDRKREAEQGELELPNSAFYLMQNAKKCSLVQHSKGLLLTDPHLSERSNDVDNSYANTNGSANSPLSKTHTPSTGSLHHRQTQIRR